MTQGQSCDGCSPSPQNVASFVEVELAVRDWARHDKAAAQRLRRVDNRRMGYLRSQFRDICRVAARRDALPTSCMADPGVLAGGGVGGHGVSSNGAVPMRSKSPRRVPSAVALRGLRSASRSISAVKSRLNGPRGSTRRTSATTA
jgi:hypothetical protein